MKNNKHSVLVFAFCCVAGLSLAWSASVYSDSYSYDSTGRLTGVTYDDGTSISYTYDNAGNLSQQLVTIPDLIPPNAPIVTGTTPSNLLMPTWNWSSGGNGGNGTFRYKLDDSDLTTAATETTSTSFTPSNALSFAIHTLYVQERDDAANWSDSGSFAITVVDNTPPTTTASPAGDTYTSTQSVILSCDDGSGTGCANIHFTTDGSDPTTSSSVYLTALSISADTTLKFFSVDNAGNSEAVKTEIYVVDSTAPTTTASPAGGTYTSIQSVILSCDDGTGTGCANTHYTTDGTDPNTLSSMFSTALSIDVDTTLKFFSVDNAGNSEAVKTESYVIQIAASNNPPATFDLVFPVDNATDLPAAIPLIWKITTDPDGDTVSYQVIFCDNAAFTGCSAQTVALNTQDMILYTSIAGPFTGLFILGLVFSGI